jgi:segregation and condensation protein B
MSEPTPKQILEAILFAAEEPIEETELQAHLGGEVHVADLLDELMRDYADRGVRLERQERAWAFRTAPEVAPRLKRSRVQARKLSRAALETLAIIAYHQPVTRAEIESLRGVAVGQGTLDILVDAGWVAPKGRREAPGRPVTWVTTPAFLDQFALASLDDLPRLDELEGASLFNPARDG